MINGTGRITQAPPIKPFAFIRELISGQPAGKKHTRQFTIIQETENRVNTSEPARRMQSALMRSASSPLHGIWMVK